jgi:hypothetical protein
MRLPKQAKPVKRKLNSSTIVSPKRIVPSCPPCPSGYSCCNGVCQKGPVCW